jgi:hypothetical protein
VALVDGAIGLDATGVADGEGVALAVSGGTRMAVGASAEVFVGATMVAAARLEASVFPDW